MFNSKYSLYVMLRDYNKQQMLKEEYRRGGMAPVDMVRPNSTELIVILFVIILYILTLFLLVSRWKKLQMWAQVLALLFFVCGFEDFRCILYAMFFIAIGGKCPEMGVSSPALSPRRAM